MTLGIPVDQLDFRRFGAVGDGVTDDTAAVQAAIDDYVLRHSQAEISSLNAPQDAHLIPAPPS